MYLAAIPFSASSLSLSLSERDTEVANKQGCKANSILGLYTSKAKYKIYTLDGGKSTWIGKYERNEDFTRPAAKHFFWCHVLT